MTHPTREPRRFLINGGACQVTVDVCRADDGHAGIYIDFDSTLNVDWSAGDRARDRQRAAQGG